jgi:hypothetical protein
METPLKIIHFQRNFKTINSGELIFPNKKLNIFRSQLDLPIFRRMLRILKCFLFKNNQKTIFYEQLDSFYFKFIFLYSNLFETKRSR